MNSMEVKVLGRERHGTNFMQILTPKKLQKKLRKIAQLQEIVIFTSHVCHPIENEDTYLFLRDKNVLSMKNIDLLKQNKRKIK